MPIRACFTFALFSLFLATGARAGELEPADAETLAGILRSKTGIQEISYKRVSCRYARFTATICAYEHANGSRDSFAWFGAAKAADVMLKYKPAVQLDNGLLEVAMNNLHCGASLCIFD